MWVGSQADLLRLLRQVEKRYEPLLAEHATKRTAHPRKMLRMSEDHKARILENMQKATSASDSHWRERLDEVNSDIEEETQKLQEAESEAANAGRIDMTLTGKDNERRSVTGTASDLIDYLDGRYFDEIEFSAPSGDIRNHSISLRASRRDGLYLGVSSKDDAEWSTAGFADLSEVIDKHVPKWRLVRSSVFLWFFFSALSAVGLWFVGDTIALWTTKTGKFTGDAAGLASLIWGAGMVAVTLTGMYLTRRFIPAFEVTRSGSPSRGGRVLAILGSSIGAVLLGIIGNAASKLLIG